MDDRRDRAMAVRHCLSTERMCDNESWSTMNCLIRLMMLARRTQNQLVDNSTNSRDLNVGGDCSAVDHVWALYSVDGLLNYDLFV